MPYRDFQINEILTAANVNTYLMDQTIMTFADATARDAALTSPSEGMFAYLSGTNLLTFYDGAAWQEFTSGGGGVTVSATAPASPDDGALWWDSDDGELYLYYNDGSSSQWVAAAGPSVTVAATAPTGYEGQLWLDSTDGSMYVYYTDPGGGNAQWIGAVSRSGGILRVVSATKTDTFSASVAAGASVAVPGLSITHAMASASNKLLITAFFGAAASSGQRAQVGMALADNGTLVNVGDAAGSRTLVTAGGASAGTASTVVIQNVSATFLYEPGDTASHTYDVHAICATTTTKTIYINQTESTSDDTGRVRSVSSLIIQEVAG